MKTLIKISSLLIFTSVFFLACQKETSFEQGSSTASVGSLSVDASGNCLGAVVSGTYFKDTAIKASNYVTVSVQVDTVGTYVISSDTVNGYYFKATGSFTVTGAQTVKLIGGGKPLAAGTNIFTVTYNGTVCEFTVTATTGGSSSVFTITCTGATPAGTYVAGTALTAANTITLNVNVTNIGSWNVTTAPAVNGIIFSGTGTFTSTGAHTIVLTGSGTPTAAGTNTYTVTGATGTCTFQCTVTAATGGSSVFTIACTGATPAGTYVAGTALTAANTITLNVNVTNIGSWSVTTAPAVNGIIFSGTGTFATTGAHTIVLTGSGTPTAAGTNTYTVTGGTGTCTFQCTVTAAIPDYFPRTAFSNWSYQFDSNPNDSLLIFVVTPTRTINGNTYNLFFYNDGQNPIDSFGYYRRAGADYFEWIDMGSYVGLDNPLWMEYTFLKDNLTTGGTWTSAQFTGPYTDQTSGTTSNLTLRWEFSITGQNIPVTVNGTPYTNVIQVKQELKQMAGTSWTLAAYFDCYYAKDKGLIKQDLYTNTGAKIYAQDVRRLVIY